MAQRLYRRLAIRQSNEKVDERMSGKREHQKRQYERELYIDELNAWYRREPPKIFFIHWRKWKKSRPIYKHHKEKK